MAKQGINPVEQHVEKIVLALSAVLFILVVFSYVINTPITVVLKGQSISPYDLDRQLGDAADDLARVYKAARFNPPATDQNAAGGTEKAIDDLRKNLVVLDSLPTTMVPAIAWWPDMRKPEGEAGFDVGAAHAIASISAPVVSETQTGVTNALLIASPVDAYADPKGLAALLQQSPRDQIPAGTVGQDVTWAFLKLTFDMQQQYEIFRQNGYSREQANIILFTGIQVQRQRAYPNGSAGPWEDVDTYKEVTIKSAPTAVEISPEGAIGQLDEQKVRQLFINLGAAQPKILYPLPRVVAGEPFPPYGLCTVVATDTAVTPLRPAIPRPVPRPPVARGGSSGGGRGDRGGGRGGGGGMDRGGGGARGERGGDRGGERGSPRPAAGGPAGHATMDPTALLTLNKAEQALKQKHYTEAKQFIDQVRMSPGITQQLRFQKLEQEIETAYQAWQLQEAARLQQQQDEGSRNAEIWVFDLHAAPGKTYRYRARVALFNVFSHPDIDRTELRNPRDGAQISLIGDWSEPSQPITIASPLRFFLTGCTPSGDSASIEIFRFLQGQWYNQTAHVGVGETIGDIKLKDARTSRPEIDFRTGYTVVDIGVDQAAVVEADTTGDSIKVRKTSSPVLIYMDDDGTIQQRWASRDRSCQLKKDLDYRARLAADQSSPAVGSGLRAPGSPAAATAMPSR